MSASNSKDTSATPFDWKAIEDEVLRRLKPFQRRTVDWAFECLYPSDGQPATGRFLVADEVGLGKTMVARGVLVKALRLLEGRVSRADVVYICSNADIARQNLARLRIPALDAAGFKSQGRLTLMPLIPRGDDGEPVRESALPERGINFQAMTPGTSLDFRNDPGHALERALLCLMLREKIPEVRFTPLKNLFTSQVSRERFDALINRVQRMYAIDARLHEKFLVAVHDPATGLVADIQRVATLFPKMRKYRARDPDQQDAARLIANLRRTLASVCIGALEPDLIILDEFQRFQNLLSSEDEDAHLARMLFEHEQDGHAARVLLLSATPYRMCSLAEDAGDTQHYDEFLATVRFLMGDDAARLAQLKVTLTAFNDSLRTLDPALPELARDLRIELQRQLSRVMARTDRVSSTDRRDSMIATPEKIAVPRAQDLVAYVSLQRLAAALGQPDLVEYWRSAACPLSFLSGYKLRDHLRQALDDESPAVIAAMRGPGLFLSSNDAVDADAGHARTRALASELVTAGLHRLLWMPPALPYYAPGGPFASVGEGARTKRLLFSSWRMVPRSVSTVLDRMLADALQREAPARDTARHDEVAGDYTLGYPSSVFACRIDPRGLAREVVVDGGIPNFEAVAARAQPRVEAWLGEVREKFGSADDGINDPDWYWLGPALIDWCALRDGPERDSAAWRTFEPLDMAMFDEEFGDGSTWGRVEHAARVSRWQAVRSGSSKLGRMPADLSLTLARVAVAGPAVCALRSMTPCASSAFDSSTRQGASAVGAALLHYFGHAQSVALLSGLYDESAFWRRVLAYCGEGCLQAVLDEYFAVLRDDQPADKSGDEALLALVGHIDSVLRMKPAVLRPEVLKESEDGRLTLEATSRTLRHARPLLEDKSPDDAEDGGPTQLTQLRSAFNSPFLPFVLSSTSIGQEGLDFHWYCHAIIHWNLPANPVDFEQRDGRIHRYRNHAVRRNIAHDWGGASQDSASGPDVWDWMFERVSEIVCARRTDLGGMRPAWVYQRGDAPAPAMTDSWMGTAQGAAANIERHVPAIPLSKDADRLVRMNQAVGCYRMVFAQPRQDDLLAHLQRSHDSAALAAIATEISIDLRPPSSIGDRS